MRSRGAKFEKELSARRKLLNTIVTPVGYVNVAHFVYRNSPGIVELTIARAEASPGGDKLTRGGKPLYAVVFTIGNQKISIGLENKAGGTIKLTVSLALFTPLIQELTLSGEDTRLATASPRCW